MEAKEAIQINDIVAELKKTKFRYKLVGGVDEIDVWKKIEELNRYYEILLEFEKEKSKVLVEETEKELERLRDLLDKIKLRIERNNG